MAVSIIGPKFYAFDTKGKPLSGGKVYTYLARTNIPKATYKSEDQVVQNDNPVILNSEGYADIYLDGSYKIVLKDSDENEIWTADPVSSAQSDVWANCLSATYLSSDSFNISGDLSSIYTAGRMVRLDSNDTNYIYSEIVESVFSNGETTVTLLDSVVTTGIKNSCLSIITSEQQTFNVMVNLFGPHAIYLSNVYLFNSKGPSLRINNASFIQLDNVWQLLAELQSGQSGVELWGLDSGAISGTCIFKGVFASELNYLAGTVNPDPRNNPEQRAKGLSIKNYETVTAQKIHIEGQGVPVYIDGCHTFVCDSVTGNFNGTDGSSAFFDFTGPTNGPKVFNIGSGANFSSTFDDWFKYSSEFNWRLVANQPIIGQQVSVQDGFGKANYGSKSVEFSNQLLIKDIGDFGAQLLLEHGSGTVGGLLNVGSNTRIRHDGVDLLEASTGRVKMNKPLGFAQLSGNPAIANGDVWYDPTDHRWKWLQNGAVVKFVTEP